VQKRKVSAKISFNSQGISPEFNANNADVAQTFLNNLKHIGSAEKLVTLDKQSGILYVKEKPLYIKEIDDYVTQFVKSRTQQFNVELAF